LPTDCWKKPSETQAVAHLKLALAGEPNLAEAHELLASIYLRSGQADAAIKHFEQAVSLRPALKVELAKLYQAQGQGQKAWRAATEASAWLTQELSRHPADHELRLRLAEALATTGRFSESLQALMDGLTLDPQGPFLMPAVRIMRLWAQRPGLNPTQRKQLLQQAATLLERKARLSEQERSTLAELYAELDRPGQAVAIWRELAEKEPRYHVRLAQFFAARGDREKAAEHAKAAIASLSKQLSDGPTQKQAVRFPLAEAYRLNAQFELAVETLEAGLEQAGPAERLAYRRALANCYLSWWLAEQAEGRGDMNRLRAALRYDPWNTEVVRILLGLMRQEGQSAREANQLLAAMLSRGEVPATVHLILGTEAWLRGQPDRARLHLRQAYALDPRMADAANNLAYVLAHSDPPDLQSALELINDPNNPEYRDTRGKILARLRRWKDALADLEFALKFRPADPELHIALAEVYDNLGMKHIADNHRQLATGTKQGLERADQ